MRPVEAKGTGSVSHDVNLSKNKYSLVAGNVTDADHNDLVEVRCKASRNFHDNLGQVCAGDRPYKLNYKRMGAARRIRVVVSAGYTYYGFVLPRH